MTQIRVTVTPAPAPPPPKELDTVNISVPRPVATAICTMLNYSPIVEAFHELIHGEDRVPFAWEGTEAHALFSALQANGVKSVYSEHLPGNSGGRGYAILERINKPASNRKDAS